MCSVSGLILNMGRPVRKKMSSCRSLHLACRSCASVAKGGAMYNKCIYIYP